MEQEDKISIVTPVYNAESFLERTILSVISQTYKNWELILIDDDSNDRSAEIISQYQNTDKRIRYIKLSENQGAAVARNQGIQMATGSFLAFLDSDDVWSPEKLSLQIAYMKDQHCDFSYTATQSIDQNDKVLKKHIHVPLRANYKTLLRNTVIATSTVMLYMPAFGSFQMPLRRSGQDYATWLMLLRNGIVAYGIDLPLTSYRITANSLSSNKFKSISQVFSIQTQNEHISVFKAAYNTTCFILYALKKHYL